MNVKKICAGFLSMLMLSVTLPVNAVNLNTLPETARLNQTAAEYAVPRIYLTTSNRNGVLLTKNDGYTEAQIRIVDTDRNIIDYSGQIKIRGNSTALAEKKPYAIKFDNKQNLFNMGKAKKWVLLANCFDPTLLRNSLAFDFAEHMNLAYTSKHIVTEVWLDGRYLGCYDLVEPVEANSTRVNIDADDEEFLLEYESSRNEVDEVYLNIDTWRFRIEEPESPNAKELSYIEKTMTNIADALKSRDYTQVEQCIDTESFAKFYLLHELFKTVDFGYSSVYFYYKNEKLYAGPVWDFDLALGNVNPDENESYKSAANPTGLYAVNKHFYKYLFRYKEFYQKVLETYIENYDNIVNIYAPDGQIDTLTNRYQTVFERNFSAAGWQVAKVYGKYARIPNATYQENIEYLRNWLRERNEWMAEYYSIFTDHLAGDVNADGVFNTLDVVLLQKFLLNVPDTELADWKAADLYEDGKLNVFDLWLMKRELLVNHAD